MGMVTYFGNMPPTITPHKLWLLNGWTFLCLEGRGYVFSSEPDFFFT